MLESSFEDLLGHPQVLGVWLGLCVFSDRHQVLEFGVVFFLLAEELFFFLREIGRNEVSHMGKVREDFPDFPFLFFLLERFLQQIFLSLPLLLFEGL